MKAFGIVWLTALALGSSLAPSAAATTNLYFTQFEPGGGFSIAAPLIGQAGWTGVGTGGNGVTNNIVAGQGQQAYVGRTPLSPGDDGLYAWRPLNFSPLAAGYPIVTFSVLMSVENSTNQEYDNFRWSVYNIAGDRLFSLDFDNFDRSVGYKLDGTNELQAAGWSFDRSVDYELILTMNFASNRWSAELNGAVILENRPITTVNAPLTLGDIDAVWLPFFTNAPGNNFMLFDDYQVTAESLPVTPARVELVERTAGGWAFLRVFGGEGARWALDATTNLVNWTPVRTNVVSGGYYDFVDMAATGPRRFYRARYLP